MENAWWDSVGALDIKKAWLSSYCGGFYEIAVMWSFLSLGEGFVYVLLIGVDT